MCASVAVPRPHLKIRRENNKVFLDVTYPDGRTEAFGPYDHLYSERVDGNGVPYFACRDGAFRYAVHGKKVYEPYESVHSLKYLHGLICYVGMRYVSGLLTTAASEQYWVRHGECLYGPYSRMDTSSPREGEGCFTFRVFDNEDDDQGTWLRFPL